MDNVGIIGRDGLGGDTRGVIKTWTVNERTQVRRVGMRFYYLMHYTADDAVLSGVKGGSLNTPNHTGSLQTSILFFLSI